MRSPHPPSKSKLKRPEPKILGERKLYPGSLSSTHTELSDQQRGEALRQLKTAIAPSNIIITGKSPFDPFTSECVRRFISELEADGLVEAVPKEGWRLTPKGLEQNGFKADAD